jgi:hypothetical protein
MKKQMTIQQRLTFTLNYIKNFMFIIVPLGSLMIYITVLVVKDSDIYKRVDEVVQWYDEKSNSFAVGLRVNKTKNDDGKTIYKTVYKATDGHIYPAVYSNTFMYWFYMDEKGVQRECH